MDISLLREMDQNYILPPVKSGFENLLITSEARSGSTYIAEVIAYSFYDAFGFEFWDLAKEPFSGLDDNSGAGDITDVLDHLFLNQAGMRSAKLLCGHLSVVNREAFTHPALKERLYGPASYWLVVRRRDTIAQAVSLAHARASGVFHAYDADQAQSGSTSSVTHRDIYAALEAISLSGYFLDLFADLPINCRTIWYEDFLADPLPCLQSICEDLSLGHDSGREFTASRAKLIRVQQQSKARLSHSFRQWLLQNYHETEFEAF